MKVVKLISAIILLSVIINLNSYKYTYRKINTKNVCATLTPNKDNSSFILTLDPDACDYDNQYCMYDR